MLVWMIKSGLAGRTQGGTSETEQRLIMGLKLLGQGLNVAFLVALVLQRVLGWAEGRPFGLDPGQSESSGLGLDSGFERSVLWRASGGQWQWPLKMEQRRTGALV